MQVNWHEFTCRLNKCRWPRGSISKNYLCSPLNKSAVLPVIPIDNQFQLLQSQFKPNRMMDPKRRAGDMLSQKELFTTMSVCNLKFLNLFDDTEPSISPLNSWKSLIAEFCAPRECALDEQNHKTYSDLRIGAICANKFPPLGQTSSRADKALSFRTILYSQACIQLAVTFQVQYPSIFYSMQPIGPIPDIYQLLGA